MNLKKILSLALALAIASSLGITAGAEEWNGGSSYVIEFSLGDMSALSCPDDMMFRDIIITDSKGLNITKFCLARPTDGFFPFERDDDIPEAQRSAILRTGSNQAGVEYDNGQVKVKIEIDNEGSGRKVKYTLTGVRERDNDNAITTGAVIAEGFTAEYTYPQGTADGVASPDKWKFVWGSFTLDGENIYNIITDLKVTVDGVVRYDSKKDGVTQRVQYKYGDETVHEYAYTAPVGAAFSAPEYSGQTKNNIPVYFRKTVLKTESSETPLTVSTSTAKLVYRDPEGQELYREYVTGLTEGERFAPAPHELFASEKTGVLYAVDAPPTVTVTASDNTVYIPLKKYMRLVGEGSSYNKITNGDFENGKTDNVAENSEFNIIDGYPYGRGDKVLQGPSGIYGGRGVSGIGGSSSFQKTVEISAGKTYYYAMDVFQTSRSGLFMNYAFTSKGLKCKSIGRYDDYIDGTVYIVPGAQSSVSSVTASDVRETANGRNFAAPHAGGWHTFEGVVTAPEEAKYFEFDAYYFCDSPGSLIDNVTFCQVENIPASVTVRFKDESGNLITTETVDGLFVGGSYSYDITKVLQYGGNSYVYVSGNSDIEWLSETNELELTYKRDVVTGPIELARRARVGVPPVVPATIDAVGQSGSQFKNLKVNWTNADHVPQKEDVASGYTVTGFLDEFPDTAVNVKVTVADAVEGLLIADYEFEGDTGDSTANGYDGEFVGGEPTYRGGAIELHGAAGGNPKADRRYIKLPDGATEDIISAAESGGFTISARLKKEAVRNEFLFSMHEEEAKGTARNKSFSVIDGGQNGSDQSAYRFEASADGTDGTVKVLQSNNGHKRAAADQEFVNLSATFKYDGGGMGAVKLYINGEDVSGEEVVIDFTPGDVKNNSNGTFASYIGLSPWDDFSWYGTIDYFKIYGVALTGDEIAERDRFVEANAYLGRAENGDLTIDFEFGDGLPAGAAIEITREDNGYEKLISDMNGKKTVSLTPAGNGSNIIYTAAAKMGNIVLGSVSASLYSVVVKNIASSELGYTLDTVNPVMVAKANDVIAKGGVAFGPELTDEASLIMTKEGNEIKIKDVAYKLGIGFTVNGGSLYVGASEKTVNGGQEGKVYAVLTVGEDGVTLSGEIVDGDVVPSEAVTLSVDSVNIEFVETLIEELEFDGGNAVQDFIPEL